MYIGPTLSWSRETFYSKCKACLKRPLKKKTKNCFKDRLSLNAGQKYCRMLQGEHSAILSIFIKLLSVIKIFVLSRFERPLKTGFTVCEIKDTKKSDQHLTAHQTLIPISYACIECSGKSVLTHRLVWVFAART